MAATTQSLGQISGANAYFYRISFFFVFFSSFFLLNDICFVKQMQYMMHEQHMRSNHGNAILPASETTERSSRRPVLMSWASLTFDVRQYSSKHERVMFSNVKAAICV